MKKLLTLPMLLLTISLSAQTTIEWVSTSQQEQWKEQRGLTTSPASANTDVEVQLDKP